MQVPAPAAAMAIHDSLEEEVLIALVRASWLAAERSTAITAAAGLSPSQYNVLRILRAAGRGGLSCTEIGERMVTRDSDLTRLGALMTAADFRVRAVAHRSIFIETFTIYELQQNDAVRHLSAHQS